MLAARSRAARVNDLDWRRSACGDGGATAAVDDGRGGDEGASSRSRLDSTGGAAAAKTAEGMGGRVEVVGGEASRRISVHSARRPY
jgi:hypothetical protein